MWAAEVKAHSKIRKTDVAIVCGDFLACNAFNVCARLHEILLPTLIICGENDRMTPLAYSQQLQA